jgi:hypothetical protein
MQIEIKKSHLPNKKYNAVITGTKTIPFGQRSASDYTIHRDAERKQRYLKRHQVMEDWGDPKTAGFYSRWITWNKPTLQQSVADVNKKFKQLNLKLKV